MRELLDKIETRQHLVRETIEQVRDQITALTGQLTAAERTLNRLETTRETILEPAAEDGTPPPEPLPAGYREILAHQTPTQAEIRRTLAEHPLRRVAFPDGSVRSHIVGL
ncbi:hypothetical protein [Streptomyces sp. XH2]|uniref:hypothetical protein n=1 Tax=Streptomyces sp. XH2 TaxID=3412483 RepID=UPI003C7E5F48